MGKCIDIVRVWTVNHIVKLNDVKQKQLCDPISAVSVCDSVVDTKKSARNIGVIFDSNMSMEDQVKLKCRRCYSQLYKLVRLVYSWMIINCWSTFFCNFPFEILQFVTIGHSNFTSGEIATDQEHCCTYNFETHQTGFEILALVADTRAHHFREQMLAWSSAVIYLIVRHQYVCAPRTLRFIILDIPLIRSTIANDKTFSFAGPKLWNVPSQNLQLAFSFELLKKHLKLIYLKRHLKLENFNLSVHLCRFLTM